MTTLEKNDAAENMIADEGKSDFTFVRVSSNHFCGHVIVVLRFLPGRRKTFYHQLFPKFKKILKGFSILWCPTRIDKLNQVLNRGETDPRQNYLVPISQGEKSMKKSR